MPWAQGASAPEGDEVAVPLDVAEHGASPCGVGGVIVVAQKPETLAAHVVNQFAQRVCCPRQHGDKDGTENRESIRSGRTWAQTRDLLHVRASGAKFADVR